MGVAWVLIVTVLVAYILVVTILIWPGPLIRRRRALLRTCSLKKATNQLEEEIYSQLSHRNEGKEQ